MPSNWDAERAHMDKMAAADKAAKARGLVESDPEAVKNAPRMPEFLQKIYDRQGSTVYDQVDHVMETAGDLAAWTEKLVAGGMDRGEARTRLGDALFWYRRGRKLVREGAKERLVKA